MYPEDLYYNDNHQWARVEGEVATVGITDYAQSQMGDLVYVDLPAVGTEVHQGEPFGSIESVKAVADVFSPVSGEVVEVNEALNDTPETINQDCYGEGWMIKVRMSDPSELQSLLDSQAYQRLLA